MRSLLRIVPAICVTVGLVAGTPVGAQVHAPRKRLLVIGEEKGYRHEEQHADEDDLHDVLSPVAGE